ncbi:FHA domain-containing protein [Rubripirellula tenax]|uniref:FHA domain-containing protein n=1 Tax=Rubripirellula tenax TaxID=2528015 RepID=UPI001646012A|nr:FHA domain-containing protein [Rubripirellula tenax]
MSTEHANESPLFAGLDGTADAFFALPSFSGGSPAESSSASDSAVKSLDTDHHVASSWNGASDSVTEQTKIDSIEFRVILPGSPVRRLRLTGNRYTFGSAEGCSIRLNDDALRPMHAVLIRDRARVLVRAYSVPIEVNGTRTTEAALSVGDVLRLGTYQFELISISTGVSQQPGERAMDETTDRLAELRKNVFGDQPIANPTPVARSSSRAELPAAEDLIWRERLRREVDQWRERQSECDQREQRCDQRETHLRGRETELWSRAENLYRRESRLQSQESSVLQLHDEYVKRQQDLMDLRKQTQTHQDELDQREAEFRRQELEYRGKLEVASRQLQQSQHQAESATQAVAKMREQFESLNRQIDELSSQQNQLSDHEERQRDEHRQLRDDLESQRDEAIDAHSKSEALRALAEARIEEMESQLESLRSDSGEHHRAELEASENQITELRELVANLQSTVAEASEESARLRRDYEEACHSVRQLEGLVADSSQRGDADRESWIVEADELRAAIDQLSLELARANGEVSRLSDDNEAMSRRLSVVQTERDEAQSRPTHDAFDSLRHELESANAKLTEMKSEYEKTLDRLADFEQQMVEERQRAVEAKAAENDALPMISAIGVGLIGQASLVVDEHVEDDRDDEIQNSLVDLSGINAADVDVDSPENVESKHVESDEPSNEISSVANDDDEDEVWPTYQIADPVENSFDNDTASDAPHWDHAPESIVHSDAESADDSSVGSVEDESLELQSDSDVDDSASSWQPSQSRTESSEEAVAEETPEQNFADLSADDPPLLDENDLSNSDLSNHDLSDNGAGQSVADEPEMTNPWANAWSDESQLADGPALEDESHRESPIDADASSEMSADDASNDDQESPFGGSLASMLIQDLEAESEIIRDDDRSSEDQHSVEGTFATSSEESETPEVWNQADESPSWDREYSEESDVEEPSSSVLDDDVYEDTYHRTEMVFDRFADRDDDDDVEESDVDQMSGMLTDSVEPEVEQESEQDVQQESELSELIDEQHDLEEHADEPVMEASVDAATQDSDVTVSASDDDDDSIEAYMNRLLNRVQGSPATDETAKPETISLSTSTSMSTSASVSASVLRTGESTSDAMANSETMDPDAPLVPRSKAPERNNDLTAMRKLANDSARGAISRSSRLQTRNIQIAGVCNLAVAAVSVIAALLSTMMLDGMLLYVAWVMALIIAGISVRDAMGNFAEAKRRMKLADVEDAQLEAMSETE